MRFEHVNAYSAAPEDVREMLLDRAFREEVCVAQHALEHSVEVSDGATGPLVVITQRQAMTGAPAVATKLVGDTVRIVQREEWRSSTTADFAMEIPGKPGHLRGYVELRPVGTGGCEEVFTGEVSVRIPLVAGKLEKLIDQILRRALRREGKVGVAWLAR